MIKNTINKFLHDSLPNLCIAVIGDLMVDRYVFGDVSRISPEAPVPVNRVKQMKEVLGGAANVAANLANLDVHVYVGGVAGQDTHGNLLQDLLDSNGIDKSGVVISNERSTITKMRILGARQQMMRLDFETVRDVEQQEEEELISWLDSLCQKGLDGIVISDYGKGICTDSILEKIFNLANCYKIPTIVDPKGSQWEKYNGATYITPNVKELSERVGYSITNDDDKIVTAAKEVLATNNIQYIIATRSEKGISVIARDGRIWHNPATQQDVFDVSGAGDTVVATMICSIAANLSMRTALHIANGAAGIVVSKVGTYPIHRQELIELWMSLQEGKYIEKSLYSWEEMKNLVQQWQNQGDTVIFTNGCFDILHRGHITYLQEAAQLGDRLIIGLNSNDSVRRLKGETRPLVDEEGRACLLSALGCVDGVVLFDEDTPSQLLETIRPNILVKGGDYKVEEVIGHEFVDSVQILPFKDGYSTTNVVNKIASLVKENKL